MRRSLTLLLLVGAAALSDGQAAAQMPCVPEPPRYIHEPQLTFPFTMLETGIEGSVVVGVVVGADGVPKSVRVLESSGHAAFDTEALRAVSRARWQPMACEVAVRAPINFRQAR